jgi:hypothetical protein
MTTGVNTSMVMDIAIGAYRAIFIGIVGGQQAGVMSVSRGL